ncbi:hypothetical protein [Bacillus cereus]|uniref:hypothetical protein n=1 Tax=Bacillus cereus TaxID=1396 RepID=UPI000818904F|nr:hypothetical protein [Bacillus cereus]
MRKVQISINLELFHDKTLDGTNHQRINVYADSNNLYESLATASEALLSEIRKYKRMGVRVDINGMSRDSEDDELEIISKRIETSNVMKPFVHDDDPIQFLIKNDFRVDHEAWSSLVDIDELDLEVFKKRIPKNSELFHELKKVADRAIYGENIKQGVSYDYLIKVVAGFSSMWDKEN